MESINIRDLQHFLYCEHRWGLIAIDKVWAENIFVIKSNIMHENVHNTDRILHMKDKKIFNGISIFNDDLGIFGVTDSLVLEKNKYSIVEYKPNKPKDADFNIDDAIQVFAQKLCVDYVFNTISSGYIYYKNQKFKIKLPFDQQYDFYYEMLLNTISKIKDHLEKNQIPPIKKGQKCGGCSLKDLCMPTKRHEINIKNEIFRRMESDE